MKAAVLHAPSDLRIEDVTEPTNPRANEAIIKVRAVGICGSDIGRIMTTGTYRFPTIPGHEFSGDIVDIGSNSENFAIGDRVAVAPLIPCFSCNACMKGNYSLCENYDFMGSRSNGAFSQFLSVPIANLVKLPDKVNYESAALIEPAAIVLHGLLKVQSLLSANVAVVGCGALGYFGVGLAKYAGATKVIAIDVDQNKLDLSSKAGADLVINASTEDANSCVKDVTNGQGVDLVIEATGNNIGRNLAIQICGKMGSIILYGTSHGDVVTDENTFSQLVRQEISLIGSWNSYSAPFPGREWSEIVKMFQQNQLNVKPIISHRACLDDAPKIFRQLQDGSFGPYHKILFQPNT